MDGTLRFGTREEDVASAVVHLDEDGYVAPLVAAQPLRFDLGRARNTSSACAIYLARERGGWQLALSLINVAGPLTRPVAIWSGSRAAEVRKMMGPGALGESSGEYIGSSVMGRSQ